MTATTQSTTETFDRLQVRVFGDRAAAGTAAGHAAATALRTLLADQEQVRVVFAAAPSQDHLLATLAAADGIDWTRVTALHMDEYVGVAIDSPPSFTGYLNRRLFGLVQPGRVELIDGRAEPTVEAARYAALITAAPIDLVCYGIGENGHLAFNEPGDTDLADPAAVRVVELTHASREQQVHDDCFPSLAEVPTHALTVTVPALTAARRLIGVVVGPHKAAAVGRTLRGPVGAGCPASVLRGHPDCELYLDPSAAAQLAAR